MKRGIDHKISINKSKRVGSLKYIFNLMLPMVLVILSVCITLQQFLLLTCALTDYANHTEE